MKTIVVRKLKIPAVTLFAVVLFAVLAAGCAFGAEKKGAEPTPTATPLAAPMAAANARPWLELLLDLPEELKDTVVVEEHQGDGPARVRYYFAEDYGSLYGGLLYALSQVTPVEFEQAHGFRESNCHFLGRDGDWYYILSPPTDVQFSKPESQEAYHAAQNAVFQWIQRMFSEGIDTVDPVYRSLQAECTFPGNHINVVYHPYYGTAETLDTVWVYLLSQPARQGEGGIWCVDRVCYAGDREGQTVVPDTDMTMAEYYAQLQDQADAGRLPGLLDPLDVAMVYAQAGAPSYMQVSAGAFEVGERYQGEPTAGVLAVARAKLAEMETPLTIYQRLERMTKQGKGDVILSLTAEDGATKDLAVNAGAGSGADYISGSLSEYNWVQISAQPGYFEPAGGYLTLYETGKNACFRYAVKHNVVIYRENGIDYYYEARQRASAEEDISATDIYHFMRRWFDEAERAQG